MDLRVTSARLVLLARSTVRSSIFYPTYTGKLTPPLLFRSSLSRPRLSLLTYYLNHRIVDPHSVHAEGAALLYRIY